MPFHTPLRVQRVKAGWILLEPLSYVSKRTGETYIAPVGFTTDFASVPRAPFAFLLAGDTAHEAAVIHDYLYRYGLTDKKTADAIFKEAMQETGVSWWRRGLMHAAVSVFGGSSYKGKTAPGPQPDIYAG